MELKPLTFPCTVELGGASIALQRPSMSLGLAWYAAWSGVLVEDAQLDTTEAEIEVAFATLDICLADRGASPWGDAHARDFGSRGQAVMAWADAHGLAPTEAHMVARCIRMTLNTWLRPPAPFHEPPPAPPSSASSVPPAGGSDQAGETGGGR